MVDQGKAASLRRGALVPNSVPIVATNYKLHQEERYAMAYTLVCQIISICQRC